jgi:hypothetical protein
MLLQNNGTIGTFSYVKTDNAGNLNPANRCYGLRIATGDLNRDGQTDLLTSDNTGKLKWYSDIPSWIATTAPAPVLNVLQRSQMPTPASHDFANDVCPAIADFDADGHPDVALGLATGGVIMLHNTLRLTSFEPIVACKIMPIRIWPNPAKGGWVNIDTDEEVILCNTLGQRVLLGQQIVQQGTRQIDVSKLGAGVYFLHSDNRLITRLIIW